MNKGRRHELKMLKYKRRLKKYGLKGTEGNLFAFRSHGAPCSCSVCSHTKYQRSKDKAGKSYYQESAMRHEDIWLTDHKLPFAI